MPTRIFGTDANGMASAMYAVPAGYTNETWTGGDPYAPIQGTNPAQLAAGYNQTQQSVQDQQAFLQALQAQGGVDNQTSVFGQEQALANQLGQQAMGGGPNPAQAALAQATGQNVQQTASLMGSARGAASNPGMIARQAAQQGAAQQQQATGQAATLQAQQQIAFQQALQQQQGLMSGLATHQVGQQQQQLGNLTAAGFNQQNVNQGALANRNNVTAALGGANISAAASNSNAMLGLGAKAIGGGLSGIGEALGLARGGEVPSSASGPRSSVGHYCRGMKRGGMVPGKPRTAGDSSTNDTVPARLSPGEIVIPRSVSQSSDPVANSAAFVASVVARRRHSVAHG